MKYNCAVIPKAKHISEYTPPVQIQSGIEDTGQGVISQGSQVALVGATMPRSLDELLQDVVPVSIGPTLLKP